MSSNSQHRSAGKGRMWMKNGVRILHLRGTQTEMASQHGALLKEDIQRGAMPYLGNQCKNLITHSYLFKDHPILQKIALGFVRLAVQKPLLAQVPRTYMQQSRALSEAAGIPYEEIEQAILQADTFNILVRHALGRYVFGQLRGGFPGCTSAVALNQATNSRGVLHARNMDYPVVGRWDVFPTVIYFDPTDSDESQRYIAVTTAGVHAPGVTGVNESGLSFAAHFHCARVTSPFGMPIQFIATEALRKAKTLSQAIDVIRDHVSAGSWSIIITSAKENDAAVVEMVHGKIFVRKPENGILAHSNYFKTPELQEKEILLASSIADDYSERYHRAISILESQHGRIDAASMASLLGDHYDRRTKKVRSHANTISVVTTVTSMITELAQGRFWIANSAESPVCLGEYAGFQVEEGFENFETKDIQLLDWKSQNQFSIYGTEKREAYRLFRKGYIAYHADEDMLSAEHYLEKAAHADPSEAHFHIAYGHVCMRLDHSEKALIAFEKAAQCDLSPHMRQVVELFSAHALDTLHSNEGGRERAVAIYKKLAQSAIDPHVTQEAKVCIRKPYTFRRAHKITFDLQFCDSLEYA